MPNAYAIAHLRTPQFNDDVLDYLERIQATLDPFGGRFLVHGAESRSSRARGQAPS